MIVIKHKDWFTIPQVLSEISHQAYCFPQSLSKYVGSEDNTFFITDIKQASKLIVNRTTFGQSLQHLNEF